MTQSCSAVKKLSLLFDDLSWSFISNRARRPSLSRSLISITFVHFLIEMYLVASCRSRAAATSSASNATTQPSRSALSSIPFSSNHDRCIIGENPLVMIEEISFLPRGYPSFSNSLTFFDVSPRSGTWGVSSSSNSPIPFKSRNSSFDVSYIVTTGEELSLSVAWSSSTAAIAANTPLDPPPMMAIFGNFVASERASERERLQLKEINKAIPNRKLIFIPMLGVIF
mmetsp:Transcript_27510/g.40648  ORF Transcript_27510/g.40648 Transcript_27510/m.40648 type:complete len:226 (-) Transcript_27510:2-679(-)